MSSHFNQPIFKSLQPWKRALIRRCPVKMWRMDMCYTPKNGFCDRYRFFFGGRGWKTAFLLMLAKPSLDCFFFSAGVWSSLDCFLYAFIGNIYRKPGKTMLLFCFPHEIPTFPKSNQPVSIQSCFLDSRADWASLKLIGTSRLGTYSTCLG